MRNYIYAENTRATRSAKVLEHLNKASDELDTAKELATQHTGRNADRLIDRHLRLAEQHRLLADSVLATVTGGEE